MARIYDNWERLVTATLRREQLRLSGQRTPSDISSASLSSFSFNSSSGRVSSFNFSSSFIGGSFTHHQILKATDHLSDSNLIKHGHSGELFYGVLEGGAEVVVKKIDLSLPETESYFISEFEFLGKVSHPRLIPLLGHCLEHGNEKFLVYKYMPNKDLSTSLFWELDTDFDNDDDSPRFSSLDWVTRLKIAIGVGEGLCYLHHECVPPLVHRDIQASSILLDENFEVRLGSLTELCPAAGKDSNQNRIARFLRLPRGSALGTSGKSNATFAYDVYCFGKVLLQLITGKLNLTVLLELVTRKLRLSSDSIDNPRAKLNTLQGTNDPEEDWIENTLPYISIFDNYRNLVLNIVDPSLMIDDDLVMEVWAVSIIAKACLNPKPSRRPRMAYVLKALKNPFMMVTKDETVWGWLSTPNDPQPAVPPGSVSPVMEKRIVPEAAFRPPELELEFY